MQRDMETDTNYSHTDIYSEVFSKMFIISISNHSTEIKTHIVYIQLF